ncbi:hypothetical protein [Flavobacterium cellulosilyticum]|uniref:Baseplate protein J-like domain-containing protein n=1 Tax=Flavobacterium cellulosilyticum TaxID=2541731 RepID=A0A4R5CB80_9FLAO|nr:hypothetical protein [Flavobacterium cellulosilyticum]TDD96006.1 hypothetical protein E0F76_12925 [Flavobacterium cellulosilyticum]
MKNCNSTLSIHEGMGTTQKERVRPALQTDFFLLDERREEDFILFVQRLSKYVKFYNEFDISDGDWSNFFQKESTSILIYIASWNIELLQNSFEIKKNEILINSDFNTQKKILTDFFTLLKEEFDDLIKRAEGLDDEIIEKENLISSKFLINAKFKLIIDQIEAINDIATDKIPSINSLLKNYVFINTTQQLFGLLLSWKNFTQKAVEYQLEKYSKHSPHYALFLTFLKLLAIAKEKYNEFTKRHLDFYYKDVLKIQNKIAQPDYVHLLVEPFKVKPFLIPNNTVFSAGKNGNGKNKFYASTADHTVNQIKLNSLLSHHRNGNQFFKTTDLFNVNAKGNSFDVFANNKQEFKEGIMIASPLLFLQSGERNIHLKFNQKTFNPNDFKFYITGEKKGIEITQKINSEGFIKLTIPATEKAIVPFDAKIHKDFLVQSEFPVLKIIPINKDIITTVNKIDLKVTVNQFKSFVLQSDFGIIDVKKPFYPFGEFPKNGNGIILSSNEFFMKNKAIATFGITTLLNSLFVINDAVNLIENKGTTNDTTQKTEQVFLMESRKKNFLSAGNWINEKVTILHLVDGQWKEYSTSLTPIPNNYPLKEYHFDAVVTDAIVSNGKFRIELKDAEYSGEKYMQDYIIASQNKPATELPYKPRIKEFVFNYSVSETINLQTRTNENNTIELFHVLPYGFIKRKKGTINFSNLKSNEGAVYLGFDTIEPHDSLSFLIQLEEGTANPLLEPAKITWHYLSNNIWNDFPENEIGDETYSLTQSGLVSITVPDFIANTNTELASDLFWVRLSVSNNQAICKFFGVHTQAFKAVLVDFEKIGTDFLENTPKETISKAYKAINGVKKIIQPYSSFFGRMAEQDTTLYTRTSERLRHKNRAITSWDYERIILEEFPEVYRLKTLNHYRYDTKISNVSAGFVALIPIAKASTSENITWKPLLSLNKMLLIKEQLHKKVSPQVRINVKPPRLEKVEIQFKVKFYFVKGMDTRLYIDLLKETINSYLSPWAFDKEDFNFASEIEFSSIIQLIDNQSYVDYITDFKVNQYLLDENNIIVGSAIQNLNKIAPQSDFTLFIPTDTHLITEI